MLNNKAYFWSSLLAWKEELPTDPKQRYTDYPYLSSDTFRSFADYIIDETQIPFDPLSVKKGSIIYVSMPCLSYFFKYIFSYIKSEFILISSYHDLSAPKFYQHYLEDKKLAGWFTINLDMLHPKVEPLPLGLPLKYWNNNYLDIFKSVRKSVPFKKNKMIYGNFDMSNNLKRISVFSYFKDKEFVHFSPRKPLRIYFEDLASSYFTLSPSGWGLDCFRTWESLLLHTIPILHTTSNLGNLFSDLPVLVIDDWEIITLEFLQDQLQKFQSKKFHLEKIFAPYWLDLIKFCQKELQDDPCFCFKKSLAAYKQSNISYQELLST